VWADINAIQGFLLNDVSRVAWQGVTSYKCLLISLSLIEKINYLVHCKYTSIIFLLRAEFFARYAQLDIT